MKKGIHPERRFVTIVMNDGTEYVTRMCVPENVTRMVLDIDPTTHPAWRKDGERKLIDTSGKVSQFKKRYGSFDF